MIKLVLALVVVLVVAVAAVAALFVGGFLEAPEVRAVSMGWGEVTTEETVVNGRVTVNNRLPVGLGSSNVGLQVPVDFYEAPTFTLALPALRLDKGESTVDLHGTMRMADLPTWWPQFVSNGEVIAIRVRPRIQAKVLGRQLEQGFPAIETEAALPLLRDVGNDQPQTMGFDDAPLLEVIRSPGDHFVVGPPRPARPVLTVESWELHWGEADQASTQVLGTIVLKNELDLPLPVQGLALGINMNGVDVIPETRVTPDQPALPPGESVPFALDVQVENAKLVEWWATHLRRGEETEIRTRIGVTVVLPVSLSGGLSDEIRLPLVPVPGFSCIVQTDIMGVANYQIGRALGLGVGDEPETVAVDCRPPGPPVMGEAAAGFGAEGSTPGAVQPFSPPPVPSPVPPGLPGR